MYYARTTKFIARVQQSPWYAVLLIILALGSGSVLLYEWWPGSDAATFAKLLRFDFYIACFFLLDFLVGWFIADGYPDRRTYLRQNWTSLVSSIPVTTELTQFLRLLRIWRAWRVLRMTIGVWGMGRFLHKHTASLADKSGDFDTPSR